MRNGANVLITGGTGSFGSAVVDRLIKDKKVGRLVIFSRDEKKQHDMRVKYRDEKRLDFVVGDVRDRTAVRSALRGIDTVFHAAALKQVPTGEFFPMEVIRTNVLGTENVFAEAEEAGVKKVVLLSTDKSVNPINAMGMTKALAEKLMAAHALHASKTVYCAVRYGNVAASRGSVIPLFVEHIQAKKDLPVTVPHMTRFLLSLEDAVDLVELAMQRGEQGDTFIKKSPAATVEDLASALLTLFGSKSKMRIVGIREGEKLHELLAHHMELGRAEDLGTHFRIRSAHGFDYESYFEQQKGRLKDLPDYSSATATRLTVPQIVAFLKTLPYIRAQLAQGT